ncbi:MULTISPECIES: substrate-binding domain-containing protein [unclassified Streptosporangium]|uniref:substrate-binding domain-containing protein n=1 Tax=unclassified Streptosporangium TaxID=2632669 RepID=UPI002E2A6784|nr:MULTISPECIES: substrate-binding domain-containing protein [unclassified Streptosporangium]
MNSTLHSRGRLMAVTALAAAGALLLSSCGSGGDSGPAASPSAAAEGGDPIVALLLPENQTARYEARDKPTFEKQLAESCPKCQLKYYNAAGDAGKQLSQAESALTEGAKVLVIGPVDSNAAGAMVAAARRQGAKVMSYDRVIYKAGVDYGVKFDNVQQGAIGMQSLIDKLKADGKTSGNIVMMNGDPVDSGAKPEKEGAHSVVDNSGFTVAAEYDTKGWSAANAQNQMQQAITKIGAGKIDGVYAGNDGMATGVIAALKSAGVDPMPPVTGLDTQLDAIQKMVAGDLYESTYLPVETEAQIGAKAAAALATGQAPAGDLLNGTIDDGTNKVPAYLLESIAVTMDNMKEILLDGGYLTVEEICTADYAKACAKAGLQ